MTVVFYFLFFYNFFKYIFCLLTLLHGQLFGGFISLSGRWMLLGCHAMNLLWLTRVPPTQLTTQRMTLYCRLGVHLDSFVCLLNNNNKQRKDEERQTDRQTEAETDRGRQTGTETEREKSTLHLMNKVFQFFKNEFEPFYSSGHCVHYHLPVNL